MSIEVKSEGKMKNLGGSIGILLHGGEVIELIGDVGSGKTTLVKGIATGLGVDEHVQSPSFTINRIYKCRNNLTLAHYDFYRLNDAGIMSSELKETMGDANTVTVIEWAGVVDGVLPTDRLSIRISTASENSRELSIVSGGARSHNIIRNIKL